MIADSLDPDDIVDDDRFMEGEHQEINHSHEEVSEPEAESGTDESDDPED